MFGATTCEPPHGEHLPGYLVAEVVGEGARMAASGKLLLANDAGGHGEGRRGKEATCMQKEGEGHQTSQLRGRVLGGIH